MSCGRLQFALSQCLDGRLPAARRAVVMAHIKHCPNCAQAWEEMQRAQSMVLDVKSHKVTARFRDAVWDRIHAGEGAPEILLQGPIPTIAKVRYALVGAAAAAFLFGLYLWTADDGTVPGDNTEHDAPVAVKDTRIGQSPPAVQDARLEPLPQLPTYFQQFGVHALAAAMATQTVDKVTSAARRLRRRSGIILDSTGRQTLGQLFWNQVQDDVQTIDGGLFVLDSLRSKALVELDETSRDCMVATRHTLSLHRADSQQRIHDLVRTLHSCSLDGLANNLKVTYSIQQIRRPYPVVFEMIADNPVLQRIITELNLVNGKGRFHRRTR